jgi:3-methyladenine DNA glycosylase AlkD
VEFRRTLKFIQKAATDERNFVKKAVSWALRGVGERNRALNVAAVALAGKLAASKDATSRWIGKDALRQLATPATRKRLARKP